MGLDVCMMHLSSLRGQHLRAATASRTQHAAAHLQGKATVRCACRIVRDACTEGGAAARTVPLTAAPIKGPLFDFLELDVDMAPNAPASAALQHLARCVLQPAWLAAAVRDSRARPLPARTAAIT
jgi:hypothetical protein